MSVNIKYTVALFSALDVLVRKKMRLARFSLHFSRNRMTPYVANVGNHYTSTYFILSRLSDLGGSIYSIGLVKAVSESLQELVRASSSSMLVTLNNV